MSEEPMFPELENGGGRYAARRRVPAWTAREDFVMVASLTACGDVGAAMRTADWLCGLFDRRPTYGPDQRPTARQRVTDCHDLLEARRWKLIAGYEDRVIPNLGAVRDRVPRTWGESVLFIRPWVERGRRRDGPGIGLAALGMMLGRLDVSPITSYVAAVERNSNYTDENDSVVEPRFLRGLEETIRAYLNEPDKAAARDAWDRIVKILAG